MMKPPEPSIFGAFDAKTHFSKLLDRVAHGETITVTRHGKPIARIVPEPTNQPSSFKDWLLGGPSLEGVDLARDASPIREVDL